MILVKGNIVKETNDETKINRLKELGYEAVEEKKEVADKKADKAAADKAGAEPTKADAEPVKDKAADKADNKTKGK